MRLTLQSLLVLAGSAVLAQAAAIDIIGQLNKEAAKQQAGLAPNPQVVAGGQGQNIAPGDLVGQILGLLGKAAGQRNGATPNIDLQNGVNDGKRNGGQKEGKKGKQSQNGGIAGNGTAVDEGKKNGGAKKEGAKKGGKGKGKGNEGANLGAINGTAPAAGRGNKNEGANLGAVNGTAPAAGQGKGLGKDGKIKGDGKKDRGKGKGGAEGNKPSTPPPALGAIAPEAPTKIGRAHV